MNITEPTGKQCSDEESMTTPDERLFNKLVASGRLGWESFGPIQTFRWDEANQRFAVSVTDPTVKTVWKLDGKEIHRSGFE